MLGVLPEGRDMTDRPIIFSAPMVQALLAGRKTMTRRLAWSLPKRIGGIECKHGYDACPDCDAPTASAWQKVNVGDRLWVRETAWYDLAAIPAIGCTRIFFEGGQVGFEDRRPTGRAPGLPASSCAEVFNLNASLRRRNAIYMPRWASRLTLVVSAAKIEPLRSISASDIRAEGLVPWTTDKESLGADEDLHSQWEELWDRLHGEGSYMSGGRQGLEIVALTFGVHTLNIDQVGTGQ